MARPSEAHLDVASRLLTHACAEDREAHASVAAARTYQALFQLLAPVIGPAGFRALFARSVKLAQVHHSALHSIRTRDEAQEESVPDHVIGQIVTTLTPLGPSTASELATELYAMFYALLAKFIGETLVQTIVQEALPTVGTTGPEEKK